MKKQQLSPCNGRPWFLGLGLLLLLSFAGALPARAATLGTNIVELGNGKYNVCVYPGKAAYTSLVTTASGVFGNGTVLDYRFLNCVAGAVNLAGYAVGPGDRVLAPTNANSFNYGNDSRAQVWTTTDPGSNFSIPADYTVSTSMIGTDVRGEVNISGMYTGTLYMVSGKMPNYTPATHRISLVMSGPGKPDVSVSAARTVDPSNYYLWEFQLGDVAGYEKISYNCALESYSRGRFMGLILGGQLIPKGMVLIFR